MTGPDPPPPRRASFPRAAPAPRSSFTAQLFLAAEAGDAAAVAALLRGGADANSARIDRRRGRTTALHAAAGGGHEGAARALLESGANAHCKDKARRCHFLTLTNMHSPRVCLAVGAPPPRRLRVLIAPPPRLAGRRG